MNQTYRALKADAVETQRALARLFGITFDEEPPPKGGTFWHGTSASYADKIRRDGLRPGAAPGADAMALREGRNFEYSGVKAPAVFLTRDRSGAAAFAKYTSRLTGDKPVVLRVELPETAKLERDTHVVGDAWKFYGPISPHYIADVIDAESVPSWTGV